MVVPDERRRSRIHVGYRNRNAYAASRRLAAMAGVKELEIENARLKKLLAETELDKAMLKEIASRNW